MPELQLGVGQWLPPGKEEVRRWLVTEEASVNVWQVSTDMSVLLPPRA
jgi:hypothetical protein